ncbi:acyl-CoA dehydrogenase family protein [Brachybacterium saurashtrense]|uniref:Acyl-CoA dehydrogenase n=1 Tax=Brachybacterium saurashtrense TaxID=556288 RepID=A0A345YR67_9MICO|nr:acyl-CoA dehydrogenase family protein [Brachybacterium saurashtrense]AXK46419.1 acyl-CoA dehydrogenase [Brachybacterium saurashtrense]RRR24160.1 acyl-CoA dehydrogenase [Brachybacterium saurashtrense]
MTGTDTTAQPSPWEPAAPAGAQVPLGGTLDAPLEDRRESVVTERAVVTAPEASAATPAALLPAAADHYAVFQDVAGEDLAAWADARSLAAEVLPQINDWWDRGEYPTHLIARLGELDLLTDGLDVPGHRTLSPLATGLVNMELSRIDGSVGTMVGVQGGLALRSIMLLGSEAQKERWGDSLARGTEHAAFALTEPDHGSDSVSLETVARRDGEDWVLTGEKRWIGNGAGCHLSVVWARVDDPSDEQLHGQVSGFLVDQSLPGYEAEVIRGKVALRAIHQAHITLTDVRIPGEARLPGARSFKDTSRVLFATRAGVAWGALGHATACYEAALEHATTRIQFGRPLAKAQHVQVRLADMLQTLTSMQLHCVRLAELEAAGTIRPEQASLAKVHNTRAAREIASNARDLLGGSGILLENRVVRHRSDLEALHTYEGTDTMQSLIVGRAITGVSAFA